MGWVVGLEVEVICFLIILTKWESLLPANRDMREVMCFEIWDPTHETEGISGLWKLGRP